MTGVSHLDSQKRSSVLISSGSLYFAPVLGTPSVFPPSVNCPLLLKLPSRSLWSPVILLCDSVLGYIRREDSVDPCFGLMSKTTPR